VVAVQWKILPDLVLQDDTGNAVQTLQVKGKYTVLFFFPKAFTPGCTRECEAFSDERELQVFFSAALDQQDPETFLPNLNRDLPDSLRLVGVSPDSPEKLREFRQKHHLTVELWSDPEKELAQAMGAVKDNGGILRSTFLLDPWARIRYSWSGVKVDGHDQEVIEAFTTILEEDTALNPSILQRRAFRKFQQMDVPEEMLHRILHAASLAPSCFNNQPWRFVVAHSPEAREKVHPHLTRGNKWMEEARAFFLVYAQRENDCSLSDRREYFLFDTGMAISMLLVQATQMGLLAHPVAGFDPTGLKQAFSIPEENTLITVVALGFPAHDPERKPRQRKDPEEFIRFA